MSTTVEKSQKSTPPSPAKKRRARRRLIKRLLLIAAAIIVIVSIVWAVLPKPITIDTARVERKLMTVTIDEDGVTRFRDRYTVIVPVTSTIARLGLVAGDSIKEDQLITHAAPSASPLLDSRAKATARGTLSAAIAAAELAQARVERAQIAYKQADREAKRIHELFVQQAVAKTSAERADFAKRLADQDLTAARFAAKVAKQEVRSARAVLTNASSHGGVEALKINSPIAGEVLRVFRRDAGVVIAGERLLEIGDRKTLELVIPVLTQDAVRIRDNMDVAIVRWGGDKELLGSVHRVEPAATTKISALGVEEQRVNVIVRLRDTDTDARSLGDGFRIHARITTWKQPDVLTAPLSAIFRRNTQWAVFAVRDGRAQLTPIEIGHRSAGEVEILKGLSEGDTIVVHPTDSVADGTDVVARGGHS